MLAVLTVQDICIQTKRVKRVKYMYHCPARIRGTIFILIKCMKPMSVDLSRDPNSLSTADFETLRDTPQELRHLFEKLGWRQVVAFHTCQPMHRLHRELTLRAAKEYRPISYSSRSRMTKPGDLQYFARVPLYQAIQHHYHITWQCFRCYLALFPWPTSRSSAECDHPPELWLFTYHHRPGACAPPDVRDQGQRFLPTYAAQNWWTVSG